MKKDTLKRLKSGLLAGMLCLTMGACKREEDGETKENVETKSAAVFFVQGKALIYEEDYLITIEDDCYSIGDEIIIDYKLTLFSQGVEGIKVQSKEDAIELATAIVGEENIIYIDYNDRDMVLTYNKGY